VVDEETIRQMGHGLDLLGVSFSGCRNDYLAHKSPVPVIALRFCSGTGRGGS